MSIEAKSLKKGIWKRSVMLYTKSTLLVTATSDHFSAVNLKAPLKIQEGVLAVTPQKKKKNQSQ